MPPPDPTQPAGPQNDSVLISGFAGLKNTVSPERLSPKDLARARNIDLDDAEQAHRRRGRRLAVIGNFHSLFNTEGGRVFGVKDGVLSRINPDYSVDEVVSGIASDPLSYTQIGPMLYFSSTSNSGKIQLQTLTPDRWGSIGGDGLWFSPVVHPELPQLAGPAAPNPNVPIAGPDVTLPPINGRLFGAPPMAQFIAWYNGRIYLAAKRTLWATELYLYDFVDKTKNYRQFEADITGLAAVEDGIYVGTADAVYFISGSFTDGARTRRIHSPCIPGSMIVVPAEHVDPEARIRPDLPGKSRKAMLCHTQSGIVVGLEGGTTYNLTDDTYWFPQAQRAATMFREQDGMRTVVSALDSGGTPSENARFGDFLDATIIRANGIG